MAEYVFGGSSTAELPACNGLKPNTAIYTCEGSPGQTFQDGPGRLRQQEPLDPHLKRRGLLTLLHEGYCRGCGSRPTGRLVGPTPLRPLSEMPMHIPFEELVFPLGFTPALRILCRFGKNESWFFEKE